MLVIGAFAVVLASTSSADFELDRYSVPKELVLNVATLLGVILLAAGWRAVRAGVPDLLLFTFVGWSGVAALFATNRWISLRAFALTFSGFVVFLAARRIAGQSVIERQHPDRQDRRDLVLNALALAGTIGAATGVLQAYGLDLPGLAEERAPGGTFGNRNFLAHLTVITVPIVILAVLRARRRATTAGWLLALALCCNAIVLTRSRAGWLGLAAAATTALVATIVARNTLSPRHELRRFGAIGAAVAAGALTALVLPNTLEWRSDSPYAETLTRLTDYRGGSGRGRLIQWSNTMDLVPRNPVFGTGPGNWFIEYPLVTTPGDPSFAGADPIPTNPWPSSDWVALLAERGPVGLGLVLLTSAAIVLTAYRRLRGPDSRIARDSIAVLAVLAATAMTGLFDAVLLNPAPMFFVAVATGLLLPRSGHAIDQRLTRRGHIALAALALAISIAGVTRSTQQLAAIRLVDNGERSTAAMERALEIDPPNHRLHLRLATRGNCTARIPHARAARRLMPNHDAPRRAVAACE